APAVGLIFFDLFRSRAFVDRDHGARPPRCGATQCSLLMGYPLNRQQVGPNFPPLGDSKARPTRSPGARYGLVARFGRTHCRTAAFDLMTKHVESDALNAPAHQLDMIIRFERAA